jgi:hypothetical protein
MGGCAIENGQGRSAIRVQEWSPNKHQSMPIRIWQVFVLPVIMWLLALVSGVDGKCAFYMGFIINQVPSVALLLPNP